MSHYIEYADLKGLLPSDFELQATDDDGDGMEDSFEAVRDQAEDDVNGLLSGQMTVPIENGADIPFIRSVTKYHACSILYARRKYGPEAYPHKAAYKVFWDKLVAIGNGERQLDVAAGTNAEITKPRGSVISSPSRTHSTSGSLTA